ncbi:hypothetical protein ES702_02576 [subsurface metagenome]
MYKFYIVANPAPYNFQAYFFLEIIYILYMIISVLFMAYILLEFSSFRSKVDELIKLLKEKKGF